MQQYLYKYLLLHHKLSIPALGNFMVEYQPAYYNESTGLLFPRKPFIDFNEGPAPGSDRSLIHFLSLEMGVDEITAMKEFQNFSIRLLVNMVEQHFTDLQGIGRIKKEMNGHIVFQPASNLIDILPPLRLGDKIKFKQPVVQEEMPVVNEVKEIKETRAPAEAWTPLKEKETAELLSFIRDDKRPRAKVVEMTRVTEEEDVVKEKWWIYASVLAVLGLAALLIKIL